MLTVLFIVAAVVYMLLVVISSITPVVPSLTIFELQRRTDAGDKTAELNMRRYQLAQDVSSLIKLASSLLLVALVVLLVAALGWFVGTVLAIVAGLSYSSLSRLPFVREFAAKWYKKYEVSVLHFVGRHQKIIWWLRSVAPAVTDAQLHSVEELEHLISTAGPVLSDSQKKLLLGSLAFDTRLVREVMTPRSMIESIKKSEILGPLVLDGLHKSGHSRFPVVTTDIDHVVGTLFLRDVLKVDTTRKHTATVETAMDKHVYYIHEDQTLGHALNAFLKTHHHLFIVVNEFRETVGILSLEDTIEALLGKKIVDEFDNHDDLRAVAARTAAMHRSNASARDV